MAPALNAYDSLHVGDPAPWFRQHLIGQEGLFSFDMMAGRFVALCFYGSSGDAGAKSTLERVEASQGLFDTGDLAFFGITIDAGDAENPRLSPRSGVRHFADLDGSVSRAFGVAPRQGALSQEALQCFWYVLDPRLRVIAVFPVDGPGNQAALAFLSALPSPALYADGRSAPVLMMPNVFEPQFCSRLIHLHQTGEVIDSPVMTEGAALTDHGFKRRSDCRIVDRALIAQTQTRIFRRVVPEIRHVFQFTATRLERLIVACYDVADGGRFGAHRDNTLSSTAHRRFAVSINLNDDFQGGGVVFPEYSLSPQVPPAGGALVFSCSLLHAVVPMTQGRRYACLPFLYDEAGAEVRRRPHLPD